MMIPSMTGAFEPIIRAAPTRPGTLGSARPAKGGVVVWVARLELFVVDDWTGTLATEEIERAQRFRFKEDYQRFVCGRGLLRELLGSYVGTEPSEIRFQYAANGKPELANSGADGLGFNVSHSGNYILLAFAPHRRVGVDVELVREDVAVEQIEERFFSLREQADLRGLEPLDRVPAFFRCWTRKEAYIKAVGVGLSLPLRQFDVSVLPGQPAAVLATRPDTLEAARWALSDVPVEPGYASCVAVERLLCDR